MGAGDGVSQCTIDAAQAGCNKPADPNFGLLHNPPFG